MEVTVYTDRVQAIGAGQSITVSGVDLRKVWQEFTPNANLVGGNYIVYVQDVVGNSFSIPLDSITNQKTWKNSFDGAAEAIRDISTITGVTPSTGVTIYSDKVQITTASYTVIIKGEDIRRVYQEFTPNFNLVGGNYIVYITDSEGNTFPIPLDSQTNQGAWKNSFDGAAEAIKDISVIAGIAPPSGSGDVVGPALSTDNAIARFDGITGKLIQNSVVLLDDNGKLGGVDAIDFDINPATPIAERRLQWNDQQGSLQLGLKGGTVHSHISEDLFLYAYNNSGSPMTKGQVVRVNGSSGLRPIISLAQADGDPNSAETIGVVAETIGNNSEGLVQVLGVMTNLNTNAFNDGDILYLSPTVAGQMTNVKPQAPQHLVRIAYCIKKAGGAGEIYISPLNGFEIEELHDVRITTPATNTCGLYWNAGLGVWENLTPANARAALGFTDPSFITYTGGSLTTTSVTLADVHSSAAFSSVAAGFYEFEFRVTYDVNATSTGAGFTARTVGGSNSYQAIVTDYLALTTDASSIPGGFSTDLTVASSRVTSGNTAIVRGVVNVTSTTDIRLQYRTETATTTSVTVTNVIGYLFKKS